MDVTGEVFPEPEEEEEDPVQDRFKTVSYDLV